MNLIAVGMIFFGALLLIIGLFMLAKRKKVIGFSLSFFGLATAVAPFVITFLLFR